MNSKDGLEKCTREIFESLFPAEIFVEVAQPEDWNRPLKAQQEKPLKNAVPQRIAEFRAGRHAAHRAMARLLKAEPPLISIGKDRSPQWPAGVVGSISHTKTLCATAVGSKQLTQGLGIDIEPKNPLEVALIPYVCSLSEQEKLTDSLFAKYIFCVKESFFKLYAPITGDFLDFLDADFCWKIDRHVEIQGERLPVYRFELIGLEQNWALFRNCRIHLVVMMEYIFCTALL